MKKQSLPVQLGMLLISFILSYFLIGLIFTFASPTEVSSSYDPLITILSIVVSFVVVLIVDYNDVFRAKNEVQKTKVDILSALEIRDSLIDRAEIIVDKFAENEKDIFKSFADARKSNKNVSTKFKSIVEQYPEMKSNHTVLSLINELDKSEGVILNSRNKYTRAAAEYNTLIHLFPVVILKPLCKWQDEDINSIFDK